MGKTAEVEMTTEQKTFTTPAMAEQYLGYSTEPSDVDWEPLREPAPSEGNGRDDSQSTPNEEAHSLRSRYTQAAVRKVNKLQIRGALTRERQCQQSSTIRLVYSQLFDYSLHFGVGHPSHHLTVSLEVSLQSR
jgi:hypothetical protein